MARKPRTHSTPEQAPVAETLPFDTQKFENVQQIGGIQVADLHSPFGSGLITRVAMVNTGAGLRFTVALDRGGDIVECFHQHRSLAYLSPNGHTPPSPARHVGAEWLRGWPGGFLTSCGPVYFGPPRQEDGQTVSLHGHHSNTPAAVEMVLNPDPHRGRREMLLSMVIRDTRMFGPNIEVRRQVQCVLGVNDILLHDTVINRGNQRSAHNWLYHVNLGYPLLDRGARFVYRGRGAVLGAAAASAAQLRKLKTASDPLDEHRGSGERVLMIDPTPDDGGFCHVGLVNPALNLAVELAYEHAAMPRLANWQHYGPGGSYVTGIEPFCGSLLGKPSDPHPLAAQWLEPGESRSYRSTIRVHSDRAAVAAFLSHDGELSPA